MALQIWLPLTGDIHNQGLDPMTFNRNTPTTWVSSSGMVGYCYSLSGFNGSGIYSTSNLSEFRPKYIDNHSFSICAFFNTRETGYTTPLLSITYGIRCFVGKGTIFHLYTSAYGTSVRLECNANMTTNDGKWHHYAATYSAEENKMAIYVDGVLKNRIDYTIGSGQTYRNVWTNNFYIGRDPNASTANAGYFFQGSVNDVRFYDHCLSDREVKEISKALMFHMKLSEPLFEGNGNLVRDGWGGTSNWANKSAPYAITTDVPSGLGITHSYTNNYTLDLIPINSDHSYSFSAYMKKNSGSTGTYCYLALGPYDIDKNFISHANCSAAFKGGTTLAKDLVSGDTVVYVTSAANWITTGSNNEYIAIFGYTDSAGYRYPDYTYTRKLYGINKANINKTNNTVPLTAAYNGPRVPKGTAVCQSTAGGTYYYPYSTAASNVTNWTLITTSFIPKNTPRLYAARYLTVYSISGYQYLAGITLKDNTMTNIVHDSSGQGNNGEIVGSLPIMDGAPKHENSLYIEDGRYNYIRSRFMLPLYEATMSIWIKTISTGFSNYHIPMACGTYYEISIAPSGVLRQGFTVNGARKVIDTTSKNVMDGQWHMLTATFDGSAIRRYVDGEEVGSAQSAPGVLTSGERNLLIGTFTEDHTYGCNKCNLSDARMYGKALSAVDVKELYNLGASIDNKGNIFAFEIKEN